MKKVSLGNSGIEVTRLCFGSLVMGPLQRSLSIKDGGRIMAYAFQQGINFVDSAQLYNTYPYIKEAMKISGIRPVISSKSYAYSEEDAKSSLEEALTELDIDYIDIFMLHEQESRLTLRGHDDAFQYYIRQKKAGKIRAVGVSTHNIEVVEACADMDGIDVIHPLVNCTGLGIGDGNIDQMLNAVKRASDNGKGIFTMKALGGGNHISKYNEAMEFVLKKEYIDSVAVGMQCKEEIDMNIAVFEGKEVPEAILNKVRNRNRVMHIDDWCTGCGECARRCKQNAITIINQKATVDMNKCLLCGYCASVCPQFAIKIN